MSAVGDTSGSLVITKNGMTKTTKNCASHGMTVVIVTRVVYCKAG